MGSRFVPDYLLTQKDREEIREMSGKIHKWLLEARSTKYMAEQLHMEPSAIEYNMEEMLWHLYKRVGLRGFLRALRRK